VETALFDEDQNSRSEISIGIEDGRSSLNRKHSHASQSTAPMGGRECLRADSRFPLGLEHRRNALPSDALVS
jgi:hypothetical protein